jgi:hypothetical protein
MLVSVPNAAQTTSKLHANSRAADGKGDDDAKDRAAEINATNCLVD